MSIVNTFGFMDVHRWLKEGHFGKRVLLNGVDITDRCRAFDDDTGEAWCYTTTPPTIDPRNHDEVLVECLQGRIEVVTP